MMNVHYSSIPMNENEFHPYLPALEMEDNAIGRNSKRVKHYCKIKDDNNINAEMDEKKTLKSSLTSSTNGNC